MTWMSVFGGMIGAVLIRLLGYALDQLAQLATTDEHNNAREWFARTTARARRHRVPVFRKGMVVMYTPSANPIAAIQIPYPTIEAYQAGVAALDEPVACTVTGVHAMIGCGDPHGPHCNCQLYALQEMGALARVFHAVPERAIRESLGRSASIEEGGDECR